MYANNVINMIRDNSNWQLYAIFTMIRLNAVSQIIACNKFAKNVIKLRNAKIIAHA